MVTSLLSATESAVLCSPTSTWTEAGAVTSPVKLSKVQWAAVRMWRLVMMEPPQKGVRVLFCDHTKPTWSGRKIISVDCLDLPNLCPTCQGYSFTPVSTPPTIRVRLLACPQWQVFVLLLETVDAVGGVVEGTAWGEVVEVSNNFTLMHVDTKYSLTS